MVNNEFVGDLDQRMSFLNRQLDYLSYIEYLSPNISKNYGFIPEQIPAYKPEKLISVGYTWFIEKLKIFNYFFLFIALHK